MKKEVFVEYGLDFDNNRYGFGRSVEIEYEDGTEICLNIFIQKDKLFI